MGGKGRLFVLLSHRVNAQWPVSTMKEILLCDAPLFLFISNIVTFEIRHTFILLRDFNIFIQPFNMVWFDLVHLAKQNNRAESSYENFCFC